MPNSVGAKPLSQARGGVVRRTMVGRALRQEAPLQLYARIIRLALRAYKLTLSPLIGTQCRFRPTCSEYAAAALIAHGPVSGSWLAARRVCRCTPWGGSGYDPVPAGSNERTV
jgi:putative membrane protein insertion efficiency factor